MIVLCINILLEAEFRLLISLCVLLLVGSKTNQDAFCDFVFHRTEVAVSIEVALKKKMFFTGFTQRKSALGITCGLNFQGNSVR